jgi:membrane protease YdiL (CAAX protease family)
MIPTVIDHLIVGLLVFVLPWIILVDYDRLVRALGAGRTRARMRAYRQTILVQWGFAALLVAFWLWSGRGAAAIGLGLETGLGAGIGLVLTLAACAFLVAQVVTVRRHPEARAAVRAQVESLRPVLPHTEEEGRWFTGVSLTAGVCEEIVYRGYLMAYFAALGAPAAIVLSTLIFGLSHAYLGKAGAIRAGLIGLVVAGLYWLTGSLWAPMLLHAVADATSGIMARVSLAANSAEASRRAHGNGSGLGEEWAGWEDEGPGPQS